MFKSTNTAFLSLLCISTLAGCGSSDTATVSSSSGAAATAFKNLSAAVNKLAVSSSSSALMLSGNSSNLLQRSFSTTNDWTTASMNDPRNSGGSCQYTTQISPEDFMKIDTDKNSVRCNNSSVNVFGRIQTAFSVACAFAHLIPDVATSADLPGSGTRTYTMDSSRFATMLADCPGLDLSGVTSLSFTMTFSTPADTTHFDRSFDGTAEFQTAGGPQSATLDRVMMKFNSSITAVAMKENNGNGSTRTVVIHDLVNNLLKGEYLAGPNNSVSMYSNTLHRLYYDGNTDYGRIYTSLETFSSLSSTTPQNTNVKYVMTMNPDDLTQAGTIGLTFDGSSTGPMNKCISPSTMASTADGTVTSGIFNCSGVEGIATSLMTADSAAWNYVRANVSDWEALNSAPTLTWTKDTMYTAAPAQY